MLLRIFICGSGIRVLDHQMFFCICFGYTSILQSFPTKGHILEHLSGKFWSICLANFGAIFFSLAIVKNPGCACHCISIRPGLANLWHLSCHDYKKKKITSNHPVKSLKYPITHWLLLKKLFPIQSNFWNYCFSLWEHGGYYFLLPVNGFILNKFWPTIPRHNLWVTCRLGTQHCLILKFKLLACTLKRFDMGVLDVYV